MSDGVSTIQGVGGHNPQLWTSGESGISEATYRFGVFEADIRTGELRREGRAVHLRHQPFQVLSILLFRAGDLVTREEIKAALWADNVDVDVEQGLNYCIKEIRAALGDNADAPRFVQTLPRRGYRFLADVHRVEEALPSPAPAPTNDQTTTVAATASRSLEGGRLRRIAAVVGLGAIGLVALFVSSRSLESSPVPTATQAPTRVVVLPFNDLSSDPAPYLADGLTDELINSLSRGTQGRLAVIARSSALAFRKRGGNASAFARELGASHFVEGTVRLQGSTVRVNVSLARTSDGTQVWSESYDRGMGDLLAIERDVVKAIGAEVQVAVTARPLAATPVDPEAYLAYLRGRFEWNKRTKESLLESRGIFQALTRDHPAFALGWAGLADSHAVLMDHGHISARDAWMQARTAAETAVTLDPGLAEAWTSLGMIRALYEWSPAAAEQAFDKAAALNPGYATRLHWQSILLRSEGRYGEAYGLLSKARELDPLSLGIRVNFAGVLMELGRTQDALAEAQGIASVASTWPPAMMVLGDALAKAGRTKEAEAQYRKADALGSASAAAELASFYLSEGHKDLATQQLLKIQNMARTTYVSPYLVAVAAASLDPELAFRSLAQAFEERSPSLRMLRRDRRLNPIRKDARFVRLVGMLWPEPVRVADMQATPRSVPPLEGSGR